MNSIVSVIIPMYNVASTISRCVDSILKQSYGNTEIILIDDGSTDSTFDICNKYVSLHPNIRLFCKDNGGVSSARNMGLVHATGSFVTFVDSDDYLDEEFIESLFHLQNESNSDIVIGNTIDVYEDGKQILNSRIKDSTTLARNDAIKHFLRSDIFSPVCWGALYKKSVIEQLRFDTDMAIAEDGKFLYQAITNSNIISICKDAFYYYSIITGSAIHSGFTLKFYNELRFCELLIELNRDSAELLKYANLKLFKFIERLIIMPDLPMEEFIKLKRKYVKLFKIVKNDIPWKNKIKFFLLKSKALRKCLIRYNKLRELNISKK